jgi:HPt (histidine-containing phosphotransfer) domain-containing protein
MDDFLSKPIQAADLWVAIDHVLLKDAGRPTSEFGHHQSSREPSRAASPVEPRTQSSERSRVDNTSPPDSHSATLLNPQVILAACGGDAAILEKIRQAFQARTPDHLKALHDALRDRDAARLREAAHKLCGMVAAFSSVAGQLASDLEDDAAGGQLEKAQTHVPRLVKMVEELLGEVGGLSLDTLRRPSETRDQS